MADTPDLEAGDGFAEVSLGPARRMHSSTSDVPEKQPLNESADAGITAEMLQDLKANKFNSDGVVSHSLQPWYAVALVAFMVAIAIALEVALSFSRKNDGWPTSQKSSGQTGVLHYVYTLPPVAVAMIIVAGWQASDSAIKKMQPYIDLYYGTAPTERTLLQDYTRRSNFILVTTALTERHWAVAFSSLVMLFALGAQPLASALFTVQDIYFAFPNTPIQATTVLGLQDETSLTPYVTAAGFVSARALYSITEPPFVAQNWIVTEFDVPIAKYKNGTVFVNVPAINTTAHCVPADSANLAPGANGGFQLTTTAQGCSNNMTVSPSSNAQAGVEVALGCPSSQGQLPDPQKPVVFWAVSANGQKAAASYCFPTLQVFTGTVSVDIYTSNLNSIAATGIYGAPNNISGAPLSGLPLNGIAVNISASALDNNAQASLNAVTTTLPLAILEAAGAAPGGLDALFASNDNFANRTTTAYTLYLTLLAKELYFGPGTATFFGTVKTFQKRLVMSELSTHLLAAGLLAVALIGGLMHLLHRRLRAPLMLAYEPGTLATALAMTPVLNLPSAGRARRNEIRSAVMSHSFRIDPETGRLVDASQLPPLSGSPHRAAFGFSPRTPAGFASPSPRAAAFGSAAPSPSPRQATFAPSPSRQATFAAPPSRQAENGALHRTAPTPQRSATLPAGAAVPVIIASSHVSPTSPVFPALPNPHQDGTNAGAA